MSGREWQPGDVARFESGYVVDPATACWTWRRFLNKDGYGDIRIAGKKERVHRASYEHFVGPIPDGLVIDHLCRNRACVNPDHLEPVTDEENRMRGESASAIANRTGKCANGHDYTDDNTYWRSEGGRRCRTCELDRMRAVREVKPQRGLTFECPVCGEQRHRNGKARHLAMHGMRVAS